jgi:hypothetical protein
MTPSIISIETGRGSRLAAELDQRLAGTEPLLDVASWYAKSYLNVLSLEERLSLYARDCTDNENATLSFSIAAVNPKPRWPPSRASVPIAARTCVCATPR